MFITTTHHKQCFLIRRSERQINIKCFRSEPDGYSVRPFPCDRNNQSCASSAEDLVTVVEVVPLVAGTAPVIVGCGVVGAVVGVLGLLVESAGLGVLDERLGVKVGCLLAVENSAHLHGSSANIQTPPQQKQNARL